MMEEKILILLSMLTIILLLATLDIIVNINIEKRYSNESCIYIPAVSKESGIITEFCLKTSEGTGKVFIEVPNVFSNEYQLSFVIAKLATCKINNRCNSYDYFFYTKKRFSGEGFSGTAGFAALILKNVYKIQKNQNISITGFILPNGLVSPVGGISEKLKASKSNNLVLLAPSNYSKEIIPIYTILDIKNTLLNKSLNYSFKIPEKYSLILKEIALDICKDIEDENIRVLIENGSYYSAASLCFIKKSEEEAYRNFSSIELDKEILEFEKMINEYECKSYTCRELKFQILTRLNLSKNTTEINKKYWRFYTAKGWYKMLKELENIDRKDTCNYIDEDYEIVKLISNFKFQETDSCFEKRETLSRIYYGFFVNQNIDLKTFLESVERYLNYLYIKNGFSVTSYNYFVYGKDLINIGKVDDGILYILYAINYAI